jgi:deferrochelatase/peroxidase EfeB
LIAAGATSVGIVASKDSRIDRDSGSPPMEPFHGPHQGGIASDQQAYALFLACDLVASGKKHLRELLDLWSAVAAEITAGNPPPEPAGLAPGFSADTDVGAGLDPARLTVTFGLGPGVFGDGSGLDSQRPKHLRPIPEFFSDTLNPAWCDGDVLVQICADDAQVVSHAFRALRARMPGLARMRWTQYGFLSRPAAGGTPRNLFGHKDGTVNPRQGTSDFDRSVWVESVDEPAWFHGGSYLVFRKIRMKTADWDQLPLAEQDRIIGRRRTDGAPLGGVDEFDAVDLQARSPDGELVIPANAHIRLVKGFSMLRRSYNYDYGTLIADAGGAPDPVPAPSHFHAPGTPAHTHGGHSRLDTGLLFAAYMNDPPAQFIAAQRALATDPLNGLIQHTGSAIFAIPPGCARGEPVAKALTE